MSTPDRGVGRASLKEIKSDSCRPDAASLWRNVDRRLFADVDTLDSAALLRWYSDDASFRFAGHPPVHGKAAIATALHAFFDTIVGMHHEKTGAWIDYEDTSAVWEAAVTFTRKDGTCVTVPAMSALRLENGLIRDFRFVMDPAPLHETAPR